MAYRPTMFQPFKMTMPSLRPQEQEDPWMTALSGMFRAMPGAIGAIKGKTQDPAFVEADHVQPGTQLDMKNYRPFEGMLPNATPGMMYPPDPVDTGKPKITDPPMPYETGGGKITGPPMPYETGGGKITGPPSPYDEAKKKYEEALTAQPKKHAWWKDALVKTAQVLSNTFNPQNQVPVEGMGAMEKRRDVRRATEAYGPLAQNREREIAEAYKRKQIENVDEDNRRQQAEVERKARADENKGRYYEGVLADKKLGRELSRDQADDLRIYRKWLMENGTRNTNARIKQIDERLKDYDLDRESRERMTNMREGGLNRRQQINNAAKAELERFKAAQKSGDKAAEAVAREALTRLKAELDAGN